ncbi:hypothetical protein WICMUC_000233 [Wickerhamomyces mucosus]|uniref:glucan 1,3-beta-glucosidase n=1 Tax=Wickerhamomyces mucosus TaxID=1378264 RepID=A0A9P8TIB0_9ASCO|nr:hypothetical protein WICMUC_000233 [Wickerhamomyces mucosus]
MLRSLALSFLATLAITSPVPITDKGNVQIYKRSWDYQDDVIRGVNLGGWLVIEPFITPSLFEAFGSDESKIPVDEYHYTQYLGKELAFDRLNQHWSSWITEDDFKSIAGTGLNFVRIPVGYWAFALKDDDPYVQGQLPYLDQAVEWARDAGLKVWIDLHGAPGSQNGFDNSGLRDSYKFQEPDNLELTYKVLDSFFSRYSDSKYDDVIIGLEVLNEPLGPVLNLDELNEFWAKGYEILRKYTSSQNYIIHDGFTAAGYFDGKFLLPDYYQVVIDHHHYQVFSTSELQLSLDEKIKVVCEWGNQATSEYHWNVAAEWSSALTDCSKWVNGVGKGSRYDQTFYSDPSDNYAYIGSCSGVSDITTWSQDTKNEYRRYIEAQFDAFEKRGGWVFWTWKTESAGDWDFQKLYYHSVVPVPLTARDYPGQCN